jgi:hypothetical protein
MANQITLDTLDTVIDRLTTERYKQDAVIEPRPGDFPARINLRIPRSI